MTYNELALQMVNLAIIAKYEELNKQKRFIKKTIKSFPKSAVNP
ncbi:hypothetical protein V7659_31615 [Neobacillus drentensis]